MTGTARTSLSTDRYEILPPAAIGDVVQGARAARPDSDGCGRPELADGVDPLKADGNTFNQMAGTERGH